MSRSAAVIFVTALGLVASAEATLQPKSHHGIKRSHALEARAKVKDSSAEEWSLNDLPKTWQDGQTGTNDCTKWGKSDPKSMCQNVYINSLDDFCLWGPPGPDSEVGATERIQVAWCLRDGYGTRLIPDGTLTGTHFLQTPDYVQITGTGKFDQMNIKKGDGGGELDPHGADTKGNPIGGLVFSHAWSNQYRQIHEWMQFISDSEVCFRACKGTNKHAQQLCQHIYDTMGCTFNMPSLTGYQDGFDSCEGESADPPGIYDGSTFWQGAKSTPLPHPAAASSNCVVGPSPKSGDKLQFELKQPKHTKHKSKSSSTSAPPASTGTSANQLNLATPTSAPGSYPYTTGAKSMSPSSANQLALPALFAATAALVAAAFAL